MKYYNLINNEMIFIEHAVSWSWLFILLLSFVNDLNNKMCDNTATWCICTNAADVD